MNEVTGEKVTYIIVQYDKTVDEGSEVFVEYNEYNGSFATTVMVDVATRFEDKAQAIDLAKLQNQMSVLLKKRFGYKVVEELVKRVEVYIEPTEEA